MDPAPDALGKSSPMENQPQENRKEKVPNGRESVHVHSLTPRVDHAVPITLPRPTDVEEKDDEEETNLDILMSLMEQQDSNVTGLPVFKLF